MLPPGTCAYEKEKASLIVICYLMEHVYVRESESFISSAVLLVETCEFVRDSTS